MDAKVTSLTLDDMTSTGAKFLLHKRQLDSYKNGGGNTVISTHISPEGACNLDCPYCSVSKRDLHSRLKLDLIKDYLYQLWPRGLKAVILTGGGEPTAYKHFNELVCTIKSDLCLSIGLITNGTLADRVNKDYWDAFTWVRVSINNFPGWQEKIHIPKISGRVGLSYCYYTEEDIWQDIQRKADELNAEYIRVLPDCTLPQDKLIEWHEKLDEVLPDDDRFIHQPKLHAAPKAGICHQAYFRPYLHESGYVYPCDSVVLNGQPGKFMGKYALCKARDIGRFLDGRYQQFNPKIDCQGCVFTRTVNMLDDYVNDRPINVDVPETVIDPEFV